MPYQIHRRLLQVFVGFFALFPILLGLSGMMNGAEAYFGVGEVDPGLDSSVRFRSALLLMLGVMFFWVLPRIERQTAWFRFLLGSLFLGGLGRLLSIYLHGVPSRFLLVVLGLELLLPVVCIPWQAAVVRRSPSALTS